VTATRIRPLAACLVAAGLAPAEAPGATALLDAKVLSLCEAKFSASAQRVSQNENG
jgi:hypothetical protein